MTIEFAPELIITEYQQKNIIIGNIKFVLDKNNDTRKHVFETLNKHGIKEIEQMNLKQLLNLLNFVLGGKKNETNQKAVHNHSTKTGQVC